MEIKKRRGGDFYWRAMTWEKLVDLEQLRLRNLEWQAPRINIIGSTDTSIERAELLAAALAEAIELAKEWDKDTGKE